MKVKVQEQGEIQAIEPGVYVACLVGIAELGTQTMPFDGSQKYQIALEYELETGEHINTFGLTFNVSNEKATFQKHVKALLKRGLEINEEIELNDLLGLCCQLCIVHNDKGYAKIDTIMPTNKLTKALAPQKEPYFYFFAENGKDIPAGVPKPIREKIQESPEYKAL